MAKKFGRKVKIEIEYENGLKHIFDEQYYIDFKVEKYYTSDIIGRNTCQVSIANLNKDTKTAIGKACPEQMGDISDSKAILSVYAGYTNDVQPLLFRGFIVNSISDDKIGPDIYTRIFCQDNTLQHTVNLSINTISLKSLLRILAVQAKADISIDPTIDRVVNKTSITGSLANILAELSDDYDFKYYVDNGTIFITRGLKPLKITKKVTPLNGLLSKPSIHDTGADITILLDGGYSIGDFVELQSNFGNFNIGEIFIRAGVIVGNDYRSYIGEFTELNGQYYIKQIIHEGQTRGDKFDTQLICQYPKVRD